MLDFLSKLDKPSSIAQVECPQAYGFVGTMPRFNRLNIGIVDGDKTALKLSLLQTSEGGPVMHMRISGVNGRSVLAALRDTGILQRSGDARHSDLWEFDASNRGERFMMGHGVPVRVSDQGWSAHFIHGRSTQFRAHSRVPAFIVRSHDARTGKQDLIFALRQGETWLLIKIDPATLAYVLVRCGFLHAHDIWKQKWRVYLPSDIKL